MNLSSAVLAWLASASILAAGAGCSGSTELPALGDFPPAPRVTACVGPVDPALGALGGSAVFAGTVIEQGSGDAPEECFRGAGVVGHVLEPGTDTDGAIWYRIGLADGRSVVTGFQVEGAKAPPLAVGDPATATLTYQTQPVSSAWLTLRGADDEVEAWVTASAKLLDLDPKIEVAPGRLVGREPGGCGATDLYDALVKFDTLRAIIPLHWVGAVGKLRVVNALYGVPNYRAPECLPPPGAVEAFLVGATRLPERD